MTFNESVSLSGKSLLTALSIDTLQVNLGYLCNMACKHCHVSGSKDKIEVMNNETVNYVLKTLAENPIQTLDITGGAPELNPAFSKLVEEAGSLAKKIVVRTNLTVLFESGMDDLPELYKNYHVEIIASLPYYLEDNVDKVRGKGAFKKSIKALKKLNSLGYGLPSSPDLVLNLIFNPQGAFLPPRQDILEQEYKKELVRNFGISFNNLYTFANMPAGRFKEFLERSGNFNGYMERLKNSFNPETLNGIMCRYMINVGWDGRLYDCDFNQALNISISKDYPFLIKDFNYEMLKKRPISTDEHCFACTAGDGFT